MKRKFMYQSFLVLLLILFLGNSIFVDFPVYAYSIVTKKPTFTPVATPTIVSNTSEVDVLETRIQSLETNIQTQSEAYSATVTRMEANMNLLLSVMAVASLLVAILGFGFVKIWIHQQVEQRFQDALSKEVSELARKEIERIRNDWDPKFASLYEEYRRTITRK